MLRSECNYTGAQPYWDWTLDSPSANGSVLASPVLKAFGGNGSDTDSCIQEGPFSGPTFLNIGPVESLASNPRCLTRAVDDFLFNGSTDWEDIYPATMSAKNYYQLQAFIDGLSFVDEADKIRTSAFATPHGVGHMSIGGDVRISMFIMPCTMYSYTTSPVQPPCLPTRTSKLTQCLDKRRLLFPERSALLAPPRPSRLPVGPLANPRPCPPDRYRWPKDHGGLRPRC